MHADLGLRLHHIPAAQEGVAYSPANPGVVHADALFGSPDLIAIVAGDDIARMDAVIDRIAEIPLVVGTDSKVARWIDGVAFPLPGPPRLSRHRRSTRRGPRMKRRAR